MEILRGQLDWRRDFCFISTMVSSQYAPGSVAAVMFWEVSSDFSRWESKLLKDSCKSSRHALSLFLSRPLRYPSFHTTCTHHRMRAPDSTETAPTVYRVAEVVGWKHAKPNATTNAKVLHRNSQPLYTVWGNRRNTYAQFKKASGKVYVMQRVSRPRVSCVILPKNLAWMNETSDVYELPINIDTHNFIRRLTTFWTILTDK